MTTGGQLTNTFSLRPWYFLLLSLFLHAAVLLPVQPESAPRVSGQQETVLSVTLSPWPTSAGRAAHVATFERPGSASGIRYKTAPPTAPAVSPASALAAKTTADVEESREPRASSEAAQSQLSPAATRAQVQALLLSHLQRYFEYPYLARARGWQGMVWLSVTVRPDGILDAVHVAKSSGYALLDRSAMEAMQHVGQVAEARRWLRDESVELPLPIVYRLTD